MHPVWRPQIDGFLEEIVPLLPLRSDSGTRLISDKAGTLSSARSALYRWLHTNWDGLAELQLHTLSAAEAVASIDKLLPAPNVKQPVVAGSRQVSAYDQSVRAAVMAEVGRLPDPSMRELHRLLHNAQEFEERHGRGSRTDYLKALGTKDDSQFETLLHALDSAKTFGTYCAYRVN